MIRSEFLLPWLSTKAPLSASPSPYQPLKNSPALQARPWTKGLFHTSLPFAGHNMADCLLPAGQAWYGCNLRASILVRLPSYCSKHLWCEQPVKEIQLTSICYVQICVYSSSSVVSYSESIVDCVRSLTPPVPITISSSQSPLLSVTPV